MTVFYCRIGWMSSYRGCAGEKPLNGGSYNKDNIGHEVHNYLGYDGKYYGFVEPGANSSIHVEKLCTQDKKADFADDILVVWVSKQTTGGQYIVGWYKNATVYRKLQEVPEEVMEMRELKSHHYYNVYSEDVTLLDVNERKYLLKGMGHSNIWYGNEETDKKVIEYIQKYDNGTSGRIEAIERGTQELEGKVRDTVVKARVNQDRFREGLMKKYKHCCLCSVDEPSLLVASHIKPWSVSDSHEKLDINNGLILCPNHDKLFDAGYISFDEQGKIVISDSLSQTNRMVMHITDTMSIDVNDDNAEYMRFHRNNVYKK